MRGYSNNSMDDSGDARRSEMAELRVASSHGMEPKMAGRMFSYLFLLHVADIVTDKSRVDTTHPTLYILFSIEEDHGRFGLVMQQNIEFIPFASLELTHPLATMN